VISDGNRSRVNVHSNHVANQKISLLKMIPVFAYDTTNMQTPPHLFLLSRGQCLEDFDEPLVRRFATQLVNDVSLRPRNDKRLSNRPASLRNQRPHSDWTVD